MLLRGQRVRLLVACLVVMAAGPVAAQGTVPASVPVLVTPVQGTEDLRLEHGDRVDSAVRGALEARGFQVAVFQEPLGQAVVACQTPECVEQALEAAGAAFAIVPAIWSQPSGGEELTLTLVQSSGRNVNASGVVGDDLSAAVGALIDELLARRAGSGTASGTASPSGTVSASAVDPGHPHAWKAGPIILITGGAVAFVAVGVAAGVKSDSQQLNTGAVAAWSAIGAAAIGGGIAWWVVGEKRRRQRDASASALRPAIGFRPTGIDLRLRF